MPSPLNYPLDLTGLAVSNRIINEVHTISVSNRGFVPAAGPFYTSRGQGLIVRKASDNSLLFPNVHYQALHLNPEATKASGYEVCSVIYIKDASFNGDISIDYGCVGGPYSTTVTAIEQMLALYALGDNAYQWAQLLNVPLQFPPTPHAQHVRSLFGMDDLISVAEGVRQALLVGDQAAFAMVYSYITNIMAVQAVSPAQLTTAIDGVTTSLNNHLTNTAGHTPAQVGLGNLNNWLTATNAETTSGLANRYVSAAGYVAALNTRFGTWDNTSIGLLNTTLSTHVTNSPTAKHTAAEVGLGSLNNWTTGTNAEHQAGTASRYASTAGVAFAVAQVTKTSLGIPLVDNTSDANKPVSGPQLTALNLKVNTSRQVLPGTLLTGGGALTADVTLNVAVALQADAEAGTSSTVAMTPLRTKQAIDKFAVPPTRKLIVAAPLTVSGGGTLNADVTIGLALATNTDAIAGTSLTTVVTPAAMKAAIDSRLASVTLGSITVTGGGLVTGGGSLDASRVLTVTAATNVQATTGTATNLAMTPASTRAAIDDRAALKTRKIQTTGLLTGGNVDLSVDRTFDVAKATSVQATTGTLDTVAMTPLTVRAAIDGRAALNTVTVTGAGLASGGGALSANQVITVTKSTLTQAEAGTDDLTAMTPLRVKDAINALAPAAVGIANKANINGDGLQSFAISTANIGVAIELGAAAVAWTPFIDFHSSGTGSDYDARIIASGGNATTGQGDLSYLAKNHLFDNDLTVGPVKVGKGKGGTNNTNTAIGAGVLDVNTDGDWTVGIGWGALGKSTTGGSNTAIGAAALFENTIGYDNVAIGINTIRNSSGTNRSTAVGSNAMSDAASIGSVAIGYEALKFSTGHEIVAVGLGALRNNTGGTYNLAVGTRALLANTTGGYNTAIGFEALRSNTTGQYNHGIGMWALRDTNGNNNIGIGLYAAYQTTSGGGNIAIGTYALNGNTTGNANIGIGYQAGYKKTTGDGNVAIGQNSLYFNMTGTYNTALGLENGPSSSYPGLTNTTSLGYNSRPTASNQVQCGYAGVTTVVYGLQNLSDRRDKTDIRDTQLGLAFLQKLRPVDYRWDYRVDYIPPRPTAPSETATPEEKAVFEKALDKWSKDSAFSKLKHDGSKKRKRFHHGLIAQELQAVIQETGVDFGGFQDHKVSGGEDVLTVGYEELIAPLIKAVQELAVMDKAKTDEIASLNAKVSAQEARLSALEELLLSK